MKYIIAFVLVGLCPFLTYAEDFRMQSVDFGAPIVTDKDNLTNTVPFGTILFDNTDGKFFGLDSSGAWQELSPGTSSTKTYSARINCDSTPGATETTDWLDDTTPVTHNATGNCTITVKSGVFSATPACTCTGMTSATDIFCEVDLNTTPSATTYRFGLTNTAGSGVDADFNVLCHGVI